MSSGITTQPPIRETLVYEPPSPKTHERTVKNMLARYNDTIKETERCESPDPEEHKHAIEKMLAQNDPSKTPPVSPEPSDEKIFQVFKNYCNSISKEVFEKLEIFRKNLELNQLILTPPTPLLTSQTAITANKVYILGKIVGQGQYTTVFAAHEIDMNNAIVREVAFKKSRAPFTKEQNTFNTLSPDSKSGSNANTNDFAESYFYDAHKNYYAVSSLSKSRLCEVNYTEKEKPITYIMEKLLDYVKGLGALHRQKVAHCDIKGPNCLSSPNKLTDFGEVVKEGSEKPMGVCTPFYAAPFMWNSLQDQLQRTPRSHMLEGDIFALGRTIQYDIIIPILEQLGTKETEAVIQKLQPRCIEFKYATSQELKGLEKKYPNQIVGNTSNIGIILSIFPTNESNLSETLRGITHLENSLSIDEVKKFKNLAELAKRLQVSDPEAIPSYAAVEAEVKAIQNSSPQSIERVVSSPQQKRRRMNSSESPS